MRYFLLVCLFYSLTACASSDDAQYYRLHPKALQEALQNCPQSYPKQISCAKLVHIAADVNNIVYELQKDPQGFGKTIITAQVQLAQLEEKARKNNKKDFSVEIAQHKQKIAEYFAIVRWIESPEK